MPYPFAVDRYSTASWGLLPQYRVSATVIESNHVGNLGDARLQYNRKKGGWSPNRWCMVFLLPNSCEQRSMWPQIMVRKLEVLSSFEHECGSRKRRPKNQCWKTSWFPTGLQISVPMDIPIGGSQSLSSPFGGPLSIPLLELAGDTAKGGDSSSVQKFNRQKWWFNHQIRWCSDVRKEQEL